MIDRIERSAYTEKCNLNLLQVTSRPRTERRTIMKQSNMVTNYVTVNYRGRIVLRAVCR